jgi:hypothetical protein
VASNRKNKSLLPHNSGEPQEVFEMIEEDLRARLAKPVESA